MLGWVMKMVACWNPAGLYAAAKPPRDSLLWYRDLRKHATGDFSVAVLQANLQLEDQSQIETGHCGTFIGIYDGHGGPEAAHFVNERLFHHVELLAKRQEGMSEDVLLRAVMTTENEYLQLVTDGWQSKPEIATSGSCCLVGVISGQNIYVANVGDSRVVVGTAGRGGTLISQQLSTEHNASIESIRRELQELHPDDSHIVMRKQGVWRVKGIIQVSRSIGDIYLKKPEFSMFSRLSAPLVRPVLSAEPSIHVHTISPEDKFLVFASDGLWEQLSNQDVVRIVQKNPRKGIARRLVKSAVKVAARKREVRYSDLTKVQKGVRRYFHDDITVVVVYLDSVVGASDSFSTASLGS